MSNATAGPLQRAAVELTTVLDLAEEAARGRGSAGTTCVDLLVALLRQVDPSVLPLLNVLREDAAVLAERVAALAGSGDRRVECDLQQLLRRAEHEAQASGGGPATPAHLLLAVVGRGGPPAALLAAAGGTEVVLRNALLRSRGSTPADDDEDAAWSPSEPTQHIRASAWT